jgi:DNA (cytosine-5)-methyltransferase 1
VNFCNENDHKAAEWIRELIKSGQIPSGNVEEKSITELSPDGLLGYDQCHFFAGIGGWPYALKLAGWPEELPVWTGSCPCQPFSIAGNRKGTSDIRHLWPEFLRLISKRRPPVIFGEQVASKDGRLWLSGVRTDLEALGYAFGAADLCAAGVGAPHIRQRLYWVANAKHAERWEVNGSSEDERHRNDAGREEAHGEPGACGEVCGVGHPNGEGFQGGHEHGWSGQGEQNHGKQHAFSADAFSPWSNSRIIQRSDGRQCRIPTEPAFFPLAHGLPGRVGLLRGYGNAIVPQLAAEFIKAFLDLKSDQTPRDPLGSKP